MKVEKIIIRTRKSGRKNAKSLEYYRQQWNDEHGAKFSLDTLYDLTAFMASCSYQRYTVIYDSFNKLDAVHNEYLRVACPERFSIEQAINDVYLLLKTLRPSDFTATLAQVHDDSNIRFLINQNYHKEAKQ